MLAAGLLAHAFLNHVTGDEISSSDSSAAAEQRERRGLVPGLVSRLIYQIILFFAKLVTLI